MSSSPLAIVRFALHFPSLPPHSPAVTLFRKLRFSQAPPYAFIRLSKYFIMDWQNILHFLLHPVIFYLLEQAVVVFILGFTSADSIQRMAVLSLLVASVWKATSIYWERIHRNPWAAFAGGLIVSGVFSYVESAF